MRPGLGRVGGGACEYEVSQSVLLAVPQVRRSEG